MDALARFVPLSRDRIDFSTIVDLSGVRDVNALPPDLNLEKVQQLFLANNQLDFVPAEVFSAAPSLAVLGLQNNDVHALPRVEPPCTSLRTLHVSNNPLQSLDGAPVSFPELRTLFAWDTKLTALPADLGAWRNLQWLDVSQSALQSLPESIGQLVQLEGLCAQHNAIMSIPSSIGLCTSLTELNLTNNMLEQIPESIAHCRQLRVLQLAHNALESLPDSVADLTALEFLDLSHNALTSLPADLGALPALRYLFLHHNRLEALPSAFVCSSALEALTVSHNALSQLPFTLGRLPRLQLLRASHNQLNALPVSLAALTSLTDLEVWGNEISDPPLSVLLEGAAAVRQHLLANLSATAPLPRVRLVLLGPAMSGKTELLRALRGDSRSLMEAARLAVWGSTAYNRTAGIRFGEWHCNDGKQSLVFTSLDCGGDGTDSYAHLFFSTHALYCIVFSLTTPAPRIVEHVLCYLQAIQGSAAGATALLVGTHLDAPTACDVRALSAALRRALQDWTDALPPGATVVRVLAASRESLVWPVSCTTGTNIPLLRSALVRSAGRSPLLQFPPPRYFIRVWEDLLAHFAGRFPTFADWSDVVEAAGGTLSDAQLLQALTHLHHCGLLLLPHERTQRPPALRPHPVELTAAAFTSPWLADTESGEAVSTTGPRVVLQQQWLADALHALCAPKELGGQGKSTLSASDLLLTLDARAPGSASRRTLQLLSDLQVCVPYDHAEARRAPGAAASSPGGGTYVIPALLPPVAAGAAGQATSAPCDLRLWLQLGIAPPALITRILAKILHGADVRSCWRTGAVLRVRGGDVALELVAPATASGLGSGRQTLRLAVSALRLRSGSVEASGPRPRTMSSLPIPIGIPGAAPRGPAPAPGDALGLRLEADRAPAPASPWTRALQAASHGDAAPTPAAATDDLAAPLSRGRSATVVLPSTRFGLSMVAREAADEMGLGAPASVPPPPDVPERAIQLLARVVRTIRGVLDRWFAGAAPAVTAAVPCAGCVAEGGEDPCLFLAEHAALAMQSDSPPLYLHCLRSGSHAPTHIGAVCPEMLAAQLDFRTARTATPGSTPPPTLPPSPMPGSEASSGAAGSLSADRRILAAAAAAAAAATGADDGAAAAAAATTTTGTAVPGWSDKAAPRALPVPARSPSPAASVASAGTTPASAELRLLLPLLTPVSSMRPIMSPTGAAAAAAAGGGGGAAADRLSPSVLPPPTPLQALLPRARSAPAPATPVAPGSPPSRGPARTPMSAGSDAALSDSAQAGAALVVSERPGEGQETPPGSPVDTDDTDSAADGARSPGGGFVPVRCGASSDQSESESGTE